MKRIRQNEIVEYILRPHYWNRWRADEIRSQAIADILVDWVWCSGKYGITFPQGILKVKQDGIVGPKTLAAVNNFPDQEALFNKIKQTRRAFLNMICIDRPANKRFLKGWLNRLNDFKWIPVLLCFGFFFSCKTSDKTVSYFFDTLRASSGVEPSIAQITVSRMVKEKNTNESKETEVQIKETDDTCTDIAVSVTGRAKKQEVTLEKNPYKKLIGWGIGIVVLIIGMRLCMKCRKIS